MSFGPGFSKGGSRRRQGRTGVVRKVAHPVQGPGKSRVVGRPASPPPPQAPPPAPAVPAQAPRAPVRGGHGTDILVSAALSIHNRSVLFRRALDGYMWQTLPPERWEIILVDDMSTEDLRQTYKHLLGRVNLRHVLFDHTRHRKFRQKNPGWIPGRPAKWYHTPALTLNVAFEMAVGPVLCVCHPEILHAPTNFERAADRLSKEDAFLFGTTYLGTQDTNRWLDSNPWTRHGWAGFLAGSDARSLRKFSPRELYWYTSFLPTAAARAVGGVDFRYLDGVAGEDDDFKWRVNLAGWPPVHAPEIEGLHQNHSHETEAHHRRDTVEWREGLRTNRELFASRKEEGFSPWVANAGLDWTAMECVVGEIAYEVGRSSPVRETLP